MTRSGLDIFIPRGLFSDTRSCSQFSVTRMWHVLDHISEPLVALRRAQITLRPGDAYTRSLH